MIFVIFLSVLILYFLPLAMFIVGLVVSKGFQIKTIVIDVVLGASDQFGRLRDLIATIAVPILALFSVKLDRNAAFDFETLSLAFVFIGSALISLVCFGFCRALRERLADYGENTVGTLEGLLENYTRETLIYFAVMLGVSAGPAVQPSP